MRRADRTARLALGPALLFFYVAAHAGVGTSTLTARTSVAANCTIATTPVAFGNYDPIAANKSTNLNATGAVTIACVKGSAPTITLSLGNNPSGSTRRMIDAVSGGFLQYELYQPSSTAPGAACSYPGTTVWGSSGANLFNAGAAPTKNPRNYNVCGTVAAGQNPTIGTYTDTVVATVSF